MSKQEKHPCEARLLGQWSGMRQEYETIPCTSHGVVKRRGKWYCMEHAPEPSEMEREARLALCELACEGYDDPMKLRNWHQGISSQIHLAIRCLTKHRSLDTALAYLNDILDDCKGAPK